MVSTRRHRRVAVRRSASAPARGRAHLVQLEEHQLEPQLVDLVHHDELQLVVRRRIGEAHLLAQDLRDVQVLAVGEAGVLSVLGHVGSSAGGPLSRRAAGRVKARAGAGRRRGRRPAHRRRGAAPAGTAPGASSSTAVCSPLSATRTRPPRRSTSTWFQPAGCERRIDHEAGRPARSALPPAPSSEPHCRRPGPPQAVAQLDRAGARGQQHLGLERRSRRRRRARRGARRPRRGAAAVLRRPAPRTPGASRRARCGTAVPRRRPWARAGPRSRGATRTGRPRRAGRGRRAAPRAWPRGWRELARRHVVQRTTGSARASSRSSSAPSSRRTRPSSSRPSLSCRRVVRYWSETSREGSSIAVSRSPAAGARRPGQVRTPRPANSPRRWQAAQVRAYTSAPSAADRSGASSASAT